MAHAATLTDRSGEQNSWLASKSEQATFWIIAFIVVWAPFPLGSNRAWSSTLLELLIAGAWLAWIPAALSARQSAANLLRTLWLPGAILGGVLIWGLLQASPMMPSALHNPVWSQLHDVAGRDVKGAISINPFMSEFQVARLGSLVALGWLVTQLALQHERARKLYLLACIAGVAYAAYALALLALDTSQQAILEGVASMYTGSASGPFVNKNSFATFDGMSLLTCMGLLVDSGRHRILAYRGLATTLRTLIRFVTVEGAPWLVGALILFFALLASNSRAGLAATIVGLVAMFLLALFIAARSGKTKWAFAGGAMAGAVFFLLFALNGHSIQSRFDDLVGTYPIDNLRIVMWQAAERAIAARPMTGFGLGTFPDVYGLYANQFVPFAIDKVHNDYLELALGLGIPAAISWLVGLFWLVGVCARAVFTRHRRRIYAITAVAASALVGFHAIFDFSLQIPAVASLYVVLLGVGLGQAVRTQ